MKTKYVIVNQIDNDLYTYGVFDDLLKAIGKVMILIWDIQKDYKKEGDTFELIGPYPLEADTGWGFEITLMSKNSKWEEPCKEYYYIFEDEEFEETNLSYKDKLNDISNIMQHGH